jgi:hypothetical protein
MNMQKRLQYGKVTDRDNSSQRNNRITYSHFYLFGSQKPTL